MREEIPHFPDTALAVEGVVRAEAGRYVLYLEVTMMPDRPDHVVTHRIADYPTRQQAEIAARWMVGAASRALPRPPLGF